MDDTKGEKDMLEYGTFAGITNAEKYKTKEERIKAFSDYCNHKAPHSYCGKKCSTCAFNWLEKDINDET